MDILDLYDPLALAVVAGGTLLAATLRCGVGDAGAALGAITRLTHRRFDAARVQAGLAEHVREVRQDGLMRARERHLGDAEMDGATDALIGKRSVAALLATHRAHRDARLAERERAVRTLMVGADLAPVAGLAGTLLALTQLRHAAPAPGDYGAAIAMAVLSTLYGLLLSHLALAPLARWLERVSEVEDAARERLVAWLAAQVETVEPHRPGPRIVAAAS